MSNQYQRSNKSCAFCHEQGHRIRECEVLANTQCKNCNFRGHTTNHCKKPRPKRVTQLRGPIRKHKFSVNENGWTTVGNAKTIPQTENILIERKIWPKLKSRPTKVETKVEKVATIKTKKTKKTKIARISEIKLEEKFRANLKPIFEKEHREGTLWSDICDEEDEKSNPDEIETQITYVFGN